MRLNLGCGNDVKEGYLNVDFRDLPGVSKVDLSKFPWPWKDGEAEEVLMLDFLEHFPYRKTDTILTEVWRVLRQDGHVDIQVPDFSECSAAMNFDVGMLCNSCGFEWTEAHCLGNEATSCGKCGQSRSDVAEAAMKRLYGGQDYEGNFHFAAFTLGSLEEKLKKNGFRRGEILEERHQRLNWNFKVRAYKSQDLWGEQ